MVKPISLYASQKIYLRTKKLRQENHCELKASLGYIVSSKTGYLER